MPALSRTRRNKSRRSRKLSKRRSPSKRTSRSRRYRFASSSKKKRSGTRQGPSESATVNRVGTVKRGLDGNLWIVVSNANGVHRWRRESGDVRPRRSTPKAKMAKKADRCDAFLRSLQRSFSRKGLSAYEARQAALVKMLAKHPEC